MPTWTSWSARAGTRWAATRISSNRGVPSAVTKVMKAPETAVLARAAILLAALTLTCLLLGGCAPVAPPGTPGVPAKAATMAAAGRSSGGIFGRVLGDPEATATGGQLYVAWQVNKPGARVPRFELARAARRPARSRPRAAFPRARPARRWPRMAGCG